MVSVPYKTLKNVSSMRKLAYGVWRKPTDPSVNVQMDIDITQLANLLENQLNSHLKYYFVKMCSKILYEIPELNTFLLRGKFRQRMNNRIFIPTIFRFKSQIDLNGIHLDDAHKFSINELKEVWGNNIKELRAGKSHSTNRAVKIFKWLPSILCRPIVKLIDFIQYSCNISLKFFGLPEDPFGSMTITFLDKFGIKYADIPIFSFSRSAITIAVGKYYKQDGKYFLPITSTFDHRCFDGFEGNKAYKRMRSLMSNPNELIN